MNQKDIIYIKSSQLISQYETQQRKDRLALKKRAELTNIIKLYFDYVYYLGVCPFRFHRDHHGKGEKFSRKIWKPQQVFCGFMHILCIFRLISQVRKLLPEKLEPLKNNPTAYFNVFLGFFQMLHKLVAMKRFWFNGHDYLKVLNEILKEKHLPLEKTWITSAVVISLLYGLFTLKIVTCLIAGYTFVIPISTWTPSWWLRRLVKQSKYVLCFTPIPNVMEAPEMDSITSWDCCLAFLMLLTQFARFCMSEFCDVYILAFTLTLWVSAESFSRDVSSMLESEDDSEDDSSKNNVIQLFPDQFVSNEIRKEKYKESKSSNWKRIYESFQAIQNVSGKQNTAVGSQIIWYLMECLMYYSIHLNSLFISTDWFDRLNTMVFVLLTVINLYLSADICNKIESVKSWLIKNDNVNHVPTDEIYLVLHEVTANDIGIRGNNTFTITFSFVAGYLSVMVTFFIICVQQNDLKAEN